MSVVGTFTDTGRNLAIGQSKRKGSVKMLVSLRIIMTDDSESKFSGFALVYGTITQQSEIKHTSLLFRSV